MNANDPTKTTMADAPTSPLRRPARHESAYAHVSGAARYVDDLPPPAGMLVGLPIGAPIACGRITRRDRAAALTCPGVHAVYFADDLPAERYIGPVIHDEPILAIDAIDTVGQVVALVVGESLAACRAAASLLEIEYEEAPPILSIEEGIAAGDFLCEPHRMQRGDVDAALAGATLRLTGEVRSGAQDHFYLETQASLAIPGEADTYEIHSSSQHPTEVQTLVAAALGIGRNQVVVKVPRMGGGFGGKESQAAPFAVLAALFGPAERGKAVSLLVMGLGIGIPLGPIIGGYLLEHFWWGSIFLINVPIAIIGAIAIAVLLPESRDPSPRRPDVLGAGLSTAGLTSLVYGVIEAPGRGWSDPVTIGAISAGVVVLTGFVAWELRVRNPMIDLHLFDRKRS